MIRLSHIFNLTPQMVIYGCVNLMSTDRIGNKDKHKKIGHSYLETVQKHEISPTISVKINNSS